MKENHAVFHRTTSRILDILELVAAEPDVHTLSSISQRLDLPKSSIFPILQEMTARNFLVLTKTQRYAIGFAAYCVGSSYLRQFHFLDAVGSVLEEMTNACQEATHFAVLDKGDVLYLKKVNSPQPIRMISYVGNRVPAYATALGKALLMDDSLDELKALYPDGLTKITPQTIDRFDVLYAQLQEAKKEGITYEKEESNQYIRCAAVPVRKEGKIIAALSVAVPVFRYDEAKKRLIHRLLLDAQCKTEQMISQLDIDVKDSL